MIRNKTLLSYTKDDKENLTIRKFTKTELKANLKKFKDKQKRRRIIQLFILTTLIILIVITKSDVHWFFSLCTVPVIFMFILDEYIDSINIKNAYDEYYIEIFIEKKLPSETYIRHSANSFIDYWPVIGKDTTTGYVSKFYIDHEQYVMLNIGNRARLRIPKDHIL